MEGLQIKPAAETDGLYHYKESGLDNYWLSSDLFQIGEYDGMKTVTFPKLFDIQATIGIHICSFDRLLGAKEIRFLRTELGFSQADMGRALGYKDKQRVAAAEKLDASRKALLGAADLLLRQLYLNAVGQQSLIGDAYKAQALELGKSLNQPHLVDDQNWEIAA